MKTKYGFPVFLGILGFILTVPCLSSAPNYGENPRINVYLIEEVSFTQAGVSPADLWQTAKKALSDLDFPLTEEKKREGEEAIMLSRILHHSDLSGSGKNAVFIRFPATLHEYYLIIKQKPKSNTLNIRLVKQHASPSIKFNFRDKMGIRALKKYVSTLKTNLQ
ncbi:MAG: hypothetical protein JXB26_16970 [Candidatus Aminicenantes bacterium]|nr:hypothetical protein [Candidatus Aminicenantes bacterium]